MARIDPNDEWLGHVQPVGLVVAPIVLARYGLTPEIQTRVETGAALAPVPSETMARLRSIYEAQNQDLCASALVKG